MSFDGLLSIRRPYERQVEVREPTLGEELIEVGREAFEFSPTQSIVRGLELQEARRSKNILSAESARAQLGNAGLREQLTVPDQGISQEALDILIRRKQIENRRADLYSRSPGGFGRGAAKLGASLGYSLFDPLNIATAFVPVVSQARYAAMLRAQAGLVGRTGVRAGVGFVEGAAGAALVEPLILGVAQAEQADYDGADSLLNIAFGGILGGGLHAVGGAGYEAVRRLRGLEALPPRTDVEAAVQQALAESRTELPSAPNVPPPVKVETSKRFEPSTVQPVDAYTESAQRILKELNSILDLDPNNTKQVSLATGEKAVSITEFVRRAGGIVDQGGELSARDVTNKTAPGLVRKDTPENRQIAGMDSVRERLFDAGYFLEKTDYNQISDSEIFDALAEDIAGNRVWQGTVRDKLSKFIGGRDYITLMEAEGFSRSMSVAQIADRLRAMDDEARAEFDVAREIDPETLREYEAFAERLNAQNAAVNIVDSLNPETRRAALQTGVAQAMDARDISVEAIVGLDPSIARGGEDFPLQSARNAAIENSRPDQAALVDFEAAAETPDPRRVPMLDAADAALADARAAADEAANAVNAEGEFRRSLMVQEPVVYGPSRRQALRELHEKVGVKFVDFTIDRGGAHTPAGPESGSPAYDVSLNGTYPDDFYGPNGLRYYSTGYEKMDAEVYSSLMRMAGRPNAIITVYRAVEKDGPKKIIPGDWVTPSRAYAKDHGESALGGNFKILKSLVHARDIYTSGDSMLEWGYHPQEFMPEVRAGAKIEGEAAITKPAAFTTNEELQLYLDFGPVPTQSGPRAVAAQRAAVKAVDDLRSSSDLLALSLSRDFAARQRVSLVGQKVSSTEDFATLAQVYRDPRFETLRYVFTDDEGNIVGQAGATSRLPASAAGWIGPEATDFFNELIDRAYGIGARGVYLLHNHPSEIARPSSSDIEFTTNVAKFFKRRGMEFRDHVIIDTNEYSVIKADGTSETIKKDFGQPSQLRLKKMASMPIQNAEVLASLARELKFDNKSTVLIAANNRYIVQNIVEVPQDKIMSYGSTPQEQARAMLALRRFALASDSSFIFAVTRDYASAQAMRNVALDTIFIDESGRASSVGAAQARGGRIIPSDRRARLSPETSETFLPLRDLDAAEAMRQKGVFEEGAAYNAGDTKDQMRPFDEAITRAEMYAQAIRAAADRVGNDDAARSAMQMASKGQLTAMEIDTLLARLKDENTRVRSTLRKAQEQFTAADKIDSLEGDATRAANSLANNIKLDATIAARNAALSLAARTKAVGRILTQFADNPSEGLLSLLGGSSFARFGSKDSAFHWQRTYFTRWTKGMLAEMEREGLVEGFASDAYSRDVARALYQMGRDEPRLEGLDPTAIKIAKIVYKYREDSRNTRNRFGAWIRDLTGYITRQQHDFMKIRAAGDKEWKDFVRQRIDVERSLKPGQNLEEFLDFVYADLAAGRHLSAVDDEAAAYTAPGSLARRASQSRVIYFKDADAEFDYLTEFGVGKLNEAILGDLSRAAQQAGLMRVLGPNPGYTLKAVMAEVEAGLVRTPELRGEFADTRDTAEGLLSMLDGTANVPGKAMAARVGSNVRVVQAMAKLGGAVISAVTDLPVYASQIKYQGRGGLFSGIAEGIGGLLQGRAKGERKRILGMIDTVADNLVGSVATRFDSDDLMSAGSADLMRLFFRLNGLQWWTDTLRESMELGTANWLGSLRDTSFDGLDANAKRLFDQYGITAPEWDVIRQGVIDAADKRTYVVPEQINQLDIEVFRNYLSKIGREPTDAAAATARRDLADRLRNFIIDQAMTAVIEPDIRSRYFWVRGLRPGTFWGEAARFIAQFKGFPTALTRQVFGREIYGRGYGSLSEYLKYGKGDMLGLAQMILMMTAFGYIAMSAKDLLKGKTPRDPENPQTWLAAMLQGGALGIYGDFLLGQSNRYGRNIIDTLAGPTFGVIGDLDELRQRAMRGDDVAASAFRILIANTPFMNLFYSRIVLDYLVLYQIQEALNPGYLRRMERQVEREQEQEFLLAPSEAVQ